MTPKRLVLALALLACVEGALFVTLNRDLVYLSQPRARLAAEPLESFQRHADRALARERLSRRHLETIADVSARRSDAPLNLRALDRLAREYPADSGVLLRFGDALRRAGRFDEAERIHQGVLRSADRARAAGGPG